MRNMSSNWERRPVDKVYKNTEAVTREAFWNIYFKVKKNQIIKQLNQILPLLLFLPEHNLFKLYASVIWNYTDHSSLTTLCELALAICPC